MNYDNLRYLLLENRCGHHESEEKPKVVFFDLGCTEFAKGPCPRRVCREPWTPKFGTVKMDLSAGSAEGPSIPLFFNLYRDRCLEFDAIYAWEAKPMDAARWWAPVPDFLRPKLHFFNQRVEELSLEASMKGEAEPPSGSFLRKLLETTKEEDFVVVKIDIDGGPELEIVEAIAARPELSRLVDELFFEYHFEYDGLDFGWEKDPGAIQRGKTVDDAVGLLRRLREAGVRSHFWI
mmetsp:Transcript_24518/g.55263  ORF Transcript_24518/g.55263 Transcript_24518/m.55263 type:complete len:235 (+) Transcript_24518:818-1522(+)